MFKPNEQKLIDVMQCADMNVKHEEYKLTYARNRALALGFGIDCDRCGGTGHYSYNRLEGTKCFKCAGRKIVLPRYSKKFFAGLEQAVADGKLNEVIEKNHKQIELKRKVESVKKALFAATGKEISKAYDDDYRINRGDTVNRVLFMLRSQELEIYNGADNAIRKLESELRKQPENADQIRELIVSLAEKAIKEINEWNQQFCQLMNRTEKKAAV
jgi:hypothetical protein